ncbi:MAG: polysaccharide pyruvyl transferase family protein [Candidatus Bathyarchaeia archaeon]|jgi:hypothetical protein
MDIIYLEDWPTNIGNTFIHLGSLQSLKTASPEARINVLGGLGRRLLDVMATSGSQKVFRYYADSFSFIRNFFGKQSDGISPNLYQKIFTQSVKNTNNFYDLSFTLNADFVVLSGCVLSNQLSLFSRSLKYHTEKNRKIILNAVGGATYSKAEVEIVGNYLKELKPYAFISRDHQSFKNYQEFAQHSYDGIDAAYFVSDYFSPPHLNIPSYVVFCFDSQSEPKINLDCDIVRTSHYAYPFSVSRAKKIYKKNNLMVSDNPTDYLTLYGNAKELHSDRVHACVAALSLGKPCKLYSKTKRRLILDRVNLGDITKGLTVLNLEMINKEKKKQINFLKEVLEGR